MTDRPIAVVVPTRDRADGLTTCLEALRASLRADDELIVVDSASTDPRVRQVAEAAGARYLRCERPGASLARNAGWRGATSEIIAFVDDDVRVAPDWADAVADAFADPEVAFVTGRVDDAGGGTSGYPVALKTETRPATIDATTAGVLGHSANLAVRRAALERIGGFDELLGAGARFRAAEDLDLFDRLLATGLVGRYDPAVAAVHDARERGRDYVLLQGAYGVGMGARIAKLVRTDRRRARMAARMAFWDAGLVALARSVRQGAVVGTLGRLLRLASMVGGCARAWLHPVRDGHLR